MAKPRRIDPDLVKRAEATVATATSADMLRQCQAVLLPAPLGATLQQTAAMLGVSPATVSRLQSSFRKNSEANPTPGRNWGGRRQSLLSPTEEREFLQPWLEKAKAGSAVVVSPIHRNSTPKSTSGMISAKSNFQIESSPTWRVSSKNWRRGCINSPPTRIELKALRRGLG